MHDALIHSLKSLKTILEGLVAVAQREQAHLIAFEPNRLNGCNDERAELLAQQREVETQIREQMDRVRDLVGISESTAPTLMQIAEHLTKNACQDVLEHANCLKALSGTLQELHRMNAVQAERGLQTVRSYLSLLVDAARGESLSTYDARGQTRGKSRKDWAEAPGSA